MSNEKEFFLGTGNVFADLGVREPEREVAKAELAFAIRTQIRARALTQKHAAILLETDRAKVAAIMSGKVSGYSYDRLVRYLNRLSCDVTIVVTPPNSSGTGTVLVKSSS